MHERSSLASAELGSYAYDLHRKTPPKHKARSQSEANPQDGVNLTLCDPKEQSTLASADLYSWKLKKGSDGVIYAVYCIHVALRSGVKWLVEKRYTQFRELKKVLNPYPYHLYAVYGANTLFKPIPIPSLCLYMTYDTYTLCKPSLYGIWHMAYGIWHRR
jgi:hypothetical protein